MLVIKSQKVTLTLFTYIVLALTLVEASSYSTGSVSRRDHGNLKRLVKKRSPFPQTEKTPKDDSNLAGSVIDDIPLAGAGKTPDTASISASLSGSASASASASASVSASDSQSASVSASKSVSASASASASVSSSSSESASSSSPTAEPSPPPANTNAVLPTKSTVTLVSTADAPEATSGDQKQSGNASTSKTAVYTALIVVASCVGGIAILWTVFRKWKLGRSKQFDQRLQPIDWQPTTHDDEGIIPPHRRHSGASSFRSGAGARNYGAASDGGHGSAEYNHSALQPLPDHDFTAGSSLAPVGGYADLSRGPSPQPQMMSERAGGYDAGVPLHHQAGYGSQDAYGGVRY